MPSFDVEFEVYCGNCGAGLCQQADGTSGPRGPSVSVDPCEKCLEEARDKGYDDGYDEGLKDGEA